MDALLRPSSPLIALSADVPLLHASHPHVDPAAGVALRLAAVLVAAKLGGELSVRLGQAAVLGELLAGVVLGNLDLLGIRLFDSVGTDPGVDLLARLGVLVLLFEAGIESTVRQMLTVGWAALRVAVLGVITPFGLGWLTARALLPEETPYCHLFVGAALTATSVGITARVFKDLGHSKSPEARVILGAAVLDDVLGLVILALVTGAIQAANGGRAPSLLSMGTILAKSLGFLVAALAVGMLLSKRLYRLAARLRTEGVLLALSLALCFALSWAADAVGLASIIGAFAAGLLLEDVHEAPFRSRGEEGVERLLQPISSFLVPVFFVVMGLRTELRVFGDVRVLLLAGALTLVAVAGKLACALGAGGTRADRLMVGFGMIPRGEVGLIFANVGLGLYVADQVVVSSKVFSSLVAVVIVTTAVTPPLVALRLRDRHVS